MFKTTIIEQYHIEEIRLYKLFKEKYPDIKIEYFGNTYDQVEWFWKKLNELEKQKEVKK